MVLEEKVADLIISDIPENERADLYEAPFNEQVEFIDRLFAKGDDKKDLSNYAIILTWNEPASYEGKAEYLAFVHGFSGKRRKDADLQSNGVDVHNLPRDLNSNIIMMQEAMKAYNATGLTVLTQAELHEQVKELLEGMGYKVNVYRRDSIPKPQELAN